MKRNKKAFLVYQAGIANVFEVDCFNESPYGRNAKRLMQADFAACENFTRGLRAAGYTVFSVGCNMAGDIINQKFETDLNSLPFCDKFHPVFSHQYLGIKDTERRY